MGAYKETPSDIATQLSLEEVETLIPNALIPEAQIVEAGSVTCTKHKHDSLVLLRTFVRLQ